MCHLSLIRVLYVDDEIHNLWAFKAGFRKSFDVFTALNFTDAIHILMNESIDVVIAEERMPGQSGAEFLDEVLTKFHMQGAILLSASLEQPEININKFTVLPKPWNENLLHESIIEKFEYNKEFRCEIKPI